MAVLQTLGLSSVLQTLTLYATSTLHKCYHYLSEVEQCTILLALTEHLERTTATTYIAPYVAWRPPP